MCVSKFIIFINKAVKNHSSTLEDSVEIKPASLLVVSLGKTP